MRVIVHQINPHVARPDDPEDCIHVGSIEIEQASSIVDQGGDLADLGIEQTDGVGVGYHEHGRLVAQLGLEVSQVDQTATVALDRDGFKPGEMGRGGVRSVGTVRNQDLRSAFASVAKISRRDQKRGQLTLRAGRRLQADGVQTRNLRQDRLQIEENGQQTLKRTLVLIGVLRAQAWQGRQSLVSLRVVLHGTRPERIEVGID